MIHDIHTVFHTPQGCCNSKYQDDKKEDIFGLNVILPFGNPSHLFHHS